MNSLNIDPRDSIDRLPLQLSLLLISLLLACFTLSQTAQVQDGGYVNANTAEGAFALYPIVTNSANTGASNTAIGFYTLFHNNTGSYNTAIGAQALFTNATGYRNAAIGYGALYFNTAQQYGDWGRGAL